MFCATRKLVATTQASHYLRPTHMMRSEHRTRHHHTLRDPHHAFVECCASADLGQSGAVLHARAHSSLASLPCVGAALNISAEAPAARSSCRAKCIVAIAPCIATTGAQAI